MTPEWAQPNPQQFTGPTGDGAQRLLARLHDLERQVRDLRSNVLKPAGITVEPDRVRFAGNVKIEGTLDLPAGIIGNDALTSPTEFGSVGLSQTAFTVPTSWGAVASGTIDIPEGFTAAAVLGIVSVGAYNPTATGGYIYVRASIDGTPGAGMPEYADATTYRAVSASAIRTLTGLTPGGTIPVAVECYAAGGWGSSGSNIANIDVIAMFRR